MFFSSIRRYLRERLDSRTVSEETRGENRASRLTGARSALALGFSREFVAKLYGKALVEEIDEES